jgi:hypothetical protein
MIYFVTEKWIKEKTSISEGVDIKTIMPLIQNAAQMWTESTIGSHFFNDLLVKFNSNGLNTNETFLVENYIKYAIAWRSAAEGVIELTWQLKNKGLQSQSGDFSQSTDFRISTWVYELKDKKGQYYENRLLDYLKENKDIFPELISPLNKPNKITDCGGTTGFNSSIMIL